MYSNLFALEVCAAVFESNVNRTACLSQLQQRRLLLVNWTHSLHRSSWTMMPPIFDIASGVRAGSAKVGRGVRRYGCVAAPLRAEGRQCLTLGSGSEYGVSLALGTPKQEWAIGDWGAESLKASEPEELSVCRKGGRQARDDKHSPHVQKKWERPAFNCK